MDTENLNNEQHNAQDATAEKVRAIKRSFRLVMNGPASQSMREKGAEYKINWGVPIMELKAMAKDYGKDYDLAIALWKEDIRECKILATLVMPAERMDRDLVDVWVEDVHSQDLGELLAFNLLQYVACAPQLAYEWIAGDNDVRMIMGYDILARLFMRGQEPNTRGIHEFLDQATAALAHPNVGVRHAAVNCLNRFADLGIVYERMADKVLRTI
ncbi:DNA alkylation repair protein [Prevotella sp. AGR2160]|uniref:DNA alkylation repair protein n=1 Tax=Prevotella sp. AGR2160 TaxID=1280674 RepID=UPI00042211D4|nr:DNA alkylation repair protein [Prevotella sp. AGR2160]